MFDFNLFEKALLDNNLSYKDKVLASYLMKKISQSKTGEVEMYIGFLANEVLNCSDSSVKRALRSITEKGYIVKRNGRGKGNKKPVIIRLNDEKSRSQVTPSYEKSRSQVTLTSESRGQNQQKVEVTGDLLKNSNIINNTKNNQSNTEEKMNNTTENMMEKTNAVTDAMTSNEVTKNGTGAKVKLTKDELKQRNDYISSMYEKLDTSLNYLNSLRNQKMYCDASAEICKAFQDATAHEDWFTDGQWKKLEVFHNRYISITEYKDKYFYGQKTDTDAETISMDEETNLNAGTEETAVANLNPLNTPNPRRQPKSPDEIREWVLKQCEKYPDYVTWERSIEAKLQRQFTSNWDSNAYAARYYNFCAGIADKYFKEKSEEEDDSIDYLLKTSEENETAPWEETGNAANRRMSDEVWRRKCNDMLHRMKLAEQNKT